MEHCETFDLIPISEINRVFIESDSAGAELDCEFLCFENVYKKVKEHCTQDTVVIDLGCSYMAQSYWFTDCKKYIGVDLPFKNNVRFYTNNSELYLMSGQEFIDKVFPTLNLDMENIIAICSYVPDEELQQMVADTFKYNYVIYCEDIISNRLPIK